MMCRRRRHRRRRRRARQSRRSKLRAPRVFRARAHRAARVVSARETVQGTTLEETMQMRPRRRVEARSPFRGGRDGVGVSSSAAPRERRARRVRDVFGFENSAMADEHALLAAGHRVGAELRTWFCSNPATSFPIFLNLGLPRRTWDTASRRAGP